MSEKTNKSFSKRLKLTKNGKVLGRKPGKNHFNARASRVTQLAGRKSQTFNMKPKTKGRFLPNG